MYFFCQRLQRTISIKKLYDKSIRGLEYKKKHTTNKNFNEINKIVKKTKSRLELEQFSYILPYTYRKHADIVTLSHCQYNSNIILSLVYLK